jgi:hypothetical protein
VHLLQVQADEIRVKAVGGIYWLACALEVRTRLWLGGVVSESRDRWLIRSVLMRVRECGSVEEVLLVTDVQGLLCQAGPARFQRAASHREKRSSEAGVGWRGDGGEDQKAL